MKNIDYLEIKPKYSSTFRAGVPISFGCNNFCTYCAVPYTRGQEISRPSELIIKECKELIKNGYKEITLLGQNVNSYGLDLKNEIKFSELLKKVDNIESSSAGEGKFWLRFISPHPKDMNDDVIKVMAEGKHICHQLNLPIQSGDNEILKRMNRNYTRENYLKLVKKIRKAIPNISLSTDIIIGFPGETKKQFKNTIKLFKEVNFDMAYISQFSPRHGTPANNMPDDVSRDDKRKRDKALNKILGKSALKYNKKKLGKEVEILVEGKNIGRTEEYKKVKFVYDAKSCVATIGEFVRVKINRAREFGLEGKIV